MIECITPVLILLTAFIGWRYHRRISAKRAALDFISKTESGSQAWLSLRQFFFERFPAAAPDFVNMLEREEVTEQEEEEFFRVLEFLAHHELVAVAIEQDAMDENMYRDWNGLVYVKAWKNAKPFIEALRGTDPVGEESYKHFQKVAERWGKKFAS